MWRYFCTRYLPTYLPPRYLLNDIQDPGAWFNVCLRLLQFCCHSCFVFFFPIPSFAILFVAIPFCSLCVCCPVSARACVFVCFVFFPFLRLLTYLPQFCCCCCRCCKFSRFAFCCCCCCCCNSRIAFFSSSSSSRDSIREVSRLSRSDLSLFHHCVYCWIVKKNRPGGWQDRRERERERITPPSCFSILFLASAPMKWWIL